MGVYKLLNSEPAIDYAEFYNGLLSDYIASNDDEYNDLFRELVNINDSICLYKNHELKVNNELIANKKIGYRDFSKIPEGFYKIPYILYWQNGDVERALIINTNNYVEARGVYYCLTEADNMLAEDKGDIVVYYLNKDNEKNVVKLVQEMIENKSTCGAIQRKYDKQFYNSLEDFKDGAVGFGKKIFAETIEKIKDVKDSTLKSNIINQTIAQAFLLKKAVYVSYMTNHKILLERHDGNVVEQRKFAKCYTDEITIVPLYDLWNKNK